jgi:hypothetical protein
LETHADITEQRHRPLRRATRSRTSSQVLTTREWVKVGSAAGLLGGILMAIPLIVWDWVKTTHLALELPTAAASWVFGLNHFSHVTYHPGPIVIGIAFLGLYWLASGLAFTGLADRFYGITKLGPSLIAGAVWSFVNFMFFWYMLLPIARDGAPFRVTAIAPLQFVAPNWVWILSWAVFGLATAVFYAVLRPRAAAAADPLGNGRS